MRRRDAWRSATRSAGSPSASASWCRSSSLAGVRRMRRGPHRELRRLPGALRLRHAAALGRRVRRHALGRVRVPHAEAMLAPVAPRLDPVALAASRTTCSTATAPWRRTSRAARRRGADREPRAAERPALRGAGGPRARRRAGRLREQRRRGARARRAARRAADAHRLRQAGGATRSWSTRASRRRASLRDALHRARGHVPERQLLRRRRAGAARPALHARRPLLHRALSRGGAAARGGGADRAGAAAPRGGDHARRRLGGGAAGLPRAGDQAGGAARHEAAWRPGLPPLRVSPFWHWGCARFWIPSRRRWRSASPCIPMPRPRSSASTA